MDVIREGAPDPSLPSRWVPDPPRTSIVLKLATFVGILVALTAGMLIGVGYYFISEIVRSQVHTRLSLVAADRQDMLLSGLRQHEERAVLFASRARIRRLLLQIADEGAASDEVRGEAERSLADARSSIPGTLAAWVETPDREIAISDGPPDLIEKFRQTEDIQPSLALRAGGIVSRPVPPTQYAESLGPRGLPSHLGETFGALFAAKSRSQEGRNLGRVMIVVDFGQIASFLINSKDLGATGEVLVGIRVGETIRFLLPPRFDQRLQTSPLTKSRAMSRAIAGDFGYMLSNDYRNKDVLVSYRPVGNSGWGLTAKMDVEEAYRPVTLLRRLLVAIGAITLGLGVAASYVIARQFTRPIRRLAEQAAAVAEGNLGARIKVKSRDELGVLASSFNRMTEELSQSYGTLEERISERTRDLEALRDLLDGLFRISTSRLDLQNIEKTFDSILRFCTQLGYELAMLSLVDREAGVIRGVRAGGGRPGWEPATVRPLDGDDILAIVVREGRPVVIPDSTRDDRCDPDAIALIDIRGQVVLPLAGDEVLGTLQVASHRILDPAAVDLRPLETLANHTVRAIIGLRQFEEIRRLNENLGRKAAELARSEEALREQTRILQSIFDCMGDGVVVADRNATVLLFNPAAERLLGRGRVDLPPEEWVRLYRVYLPDRSTPFPADDLPLVRAGRGESLDQVEMFIAYPSLRDGTWIMVNGRPLRDGRGEISGGVVVFHDITRRKMFESRLAAQYATTRVLAESGSMNEAAPKLLQAICEGLRWDFGNLWSTDPRAGVLRCVTTSSPTSPEARRFAAGMRDISFASGEGLPGQIWASRRPTWIRDFSGDPRMPRAGAAAAAGLRSAFGVPILLRNDCLGVIEFFSQEDREPDAAQLEMMGNLGIQIGQFIERQRMRARVVQSEKLASLGLLSAGVAHEINNPLAYVANNLAVLDRDVASVAEILELYEAARETIEAARPDIVVEIDARADEIDLPYVKQNLGSILNSTRQGVKRVADIVQNLRGFTRLDRGDEDQADLHEAIRSAVEMIRSRATRRNVAIEEQFGPVPPVAGSPAQLNQVFLNLLVNALQAIESVNRGGGRIVISTHATDCEVVAEVADDGCGIPAEVIPQIFDPFFTTKDVGDGTGLGLSISHGIVHDHGGRLEVESTPDVGTRFRVVLPIVGMAKPGTI
jgi:signal transduction histidine kinase